MRQAIQTGLVKPATQPLLATGWASAGRGPSRASVCLLFTASKISFALHAAHVPHAVEPCPVFRLCQRGNSLAPWPNCSSHVFRSRRRGCNFSNGSTITFESNVARHLGRYWKTRIWIAASVCVLVTIIKTRFGPNASPYPLLQLPSVIRFETLSANQAFWATAFRYNISVANNTLPLSKFETGIFGYYYTFPNFSL